MGGLCFGSHMVLQPIIPTAMRGVIWYQDDFPICFV